MRNVLFILGVAAAITLAACGSSTNSSPAPGNGSHIITFGGTSYTNGNITIAAGDSVTWQGNFGAHPLHPESRSVSCTEDTSNTPITAKTSGSDDLTITFPNAGTFPYYCAVHCSGFAMRGTITVQ